MKSQDFLCQPAVGSAEAELMQDSEGTDNSTEEMLGEKPGFSLPTCSWKCGSGTDNGGMSVGAFSVEELESMIVVEMGAYKTAKGGRKLITWDLGSCIGIALRDPVSGVGGLLHIMLPHHTCASKTEPFTAAKYANTGLDEMVQAIVHQGGRREHLVAKIAGGAHMLKSVQIPESSDISSRNLEAVEKKLGEMNIPVLASEVGGHHARTVVFEPGSGAFRIVTRGKEVKVL